MENLSDFEFENMMPNPDILAKLLGANKTDVLQPVRSGDIDYTRPLGEYPRASDLARGLKIIPNTQHIYTKDLNVGGIAVSDSFEKYLGSDHYGSSTVKEMLVTPMNFAFAISNDAQELEKVKEKKGYLDLGTFLHQAILEPTKFGRVCKAPANAPMNTKEGVQKNIDFWESMINEKGGGYNEKGDFVEPMEALKMAEDDINKLNLDRSKMDGMRAYCKALEIISGITPVSDEHFLKIQILKRHYENYAGGLLPRLLKHSKRELSMYYTDAETGVNVKVRPDALQFRENIGEDAIISIKSTGCKDLRAFAYRCAELHYDLSEGMYQDVASAVTGRDFNTTIMIMLQTVEPYSIAVLIWSPEDIENGKYKYRMALRDIANCAETGIYQGFEADAEADNMGIIDFDLPLWNNKELKPKTT